MPPNLAMNKLTRLKGISTIHETRFLNDFVPGTYQTTSTGKGHFQGAKIDVKNVTEGKGIQLNVKYNAEGEIEEVIAQEVSEGEWAFALPGYVDYMINLEGLVFNDFSLTLTPEEAQVFNPGFDFSADNLREVEKAVKAVKAAPYIGARQDDDVYLLKNTELENSAQIPEVKWVGSNQGITDKANLVELYVGELSGKMIKKFIAKLQSSHRGTAFATPTLKTDEDFEATGEEKVYANKEMNRKTFSIQKFMEENENDIVNILGPEGTDDKLIRVSIQNIEAVGIENIRDFLLAVQGTEHGFVELFSSKEDAVKISKKQYEGYGLVKQKLPTSLSVKNRAKTNTVTIFPVLKSDKVTARGIKNKEGYSWGIGNIDPKDTVLTPVGLNYDNSGLIRSMILGLRLSEIARNRYTKDDQYVADTLAVYVNLCLSEGQRIEDIDELTTGDIISLIAVNTNEMVRSLKKLIKLLPIVPMNTDELRLIYERAREIMIRA